MSQKRIRIHHYSTNFCWQSTNCWFLTGLHHSNKFIKVRGIHVLKTDSLNYWCVKYYFVIFQITAEIYFGTIKQWLSVYKTVIIFKFDLMLAIFMTLYMTVLWVLIQNTLEIPTTSDKCKCKIWVLNNSANQS